MINKKGDLKEMFLQILKEDGAFREEVRKIILSTDQKECKILTSEVD